MMQLIGTIDDVIKVVTELVEGDIDWREACRRLPAYEGVQAVEGLTRNVSLRWDEPSDWAKRVERSDDPVQ